MVVTYSRLQTFLGRENDSSKQNRKEASKTSGVGAIPATPAINVHIQHLILNF